MIEVNAYNITAEQIRMAQDLAPESIGSEVAANALGLASSYSGGGLPIYPPAEWIGQARAEIAMFLNAYFAEHGRLGELARWWDIVAHQWWRLSRPVEATMGVVDECHLESITKLSLDRGSPWAFACAITVHRGELVSPERVKAEAQAYLALDPRARMKGVKS